MNDTRRRAALAALEIPVWVARAAPEAVRAEVVAAQPAAVEPPAPEPPAPEPPPVPEPCPPAVGEPAEKAAVPASPSDWSELPGQVAACTRCALHAGRQQAVFGVGNEQADWLLIGEAPGADEDRLGEPFVGRAGKLLDAMLAALKLDRTSVYIANIVKCRPPNNRDPLPEEASQCRTYLDRQIQRVAPKVILAVGRIAAQNLLATEQAVGSLRGRVHHLPGTDIPVVVSYHPAYLLRRPEEKRKAWDDLRLAHSVVHPH